MITVHDVVEMGQIAVSEDVEHETMVGVMVSQPTKLVRMVEEIVRVLNETGEVLRGGGYQSLGAFMLDCAKRSKVEGKGASASMFIHYVYPRFGHDSL